MYEYLILAVAWLATVFAAYKTGRHRVFAEAKRDLDAGQVPEVLWHHEDKAAPILAKHVGMYE